MRSAGTAPLGVLGPGDPGIDAAGDLVDVVADVVDLGAQCLDLLGGAGFNRSSFNESNKKSPFRETALFRLVR